MYFFEKNPVHFYFTNAGTFCYKYKACRREGISETMAMFRNHFTEDRN